MSLREPWMHVVTHTDPAEFIRETGEVRQAHRGDETFDVQYSTAIAGPGSEPQLVFTAVFTWWGYPEE